MQTPRNNRSGYSLLELSVSLTAGSFLVVGLGASLLISSRMVTPPDRVRQVLDASGVSFQLTDELRYATYIMNRSDNMIQFVVSDRTGDGAPDIIRYEWSGTAGAPLTRTVNGTPHTILTDVREFSLTYDVKPKVEEVPMYLESAEQVLSSWDGSSDLADSNIKSDRWRGQYFKPTLPVGALHWKVTKARIQAKTGGSANGETLIQLRPATGSGTPTSTVLEQVSLFENTLTSSYQWKEFPYSTVSELPPGIGLCLVLQHVSDSESCKFQIQDKNVSAADAGFLESTDQGATWTIDVNQAVQHYIYGTYTSIGPPQIVTRNYLTGVNLSLRAGNDSKSRVDTATPILNSPELLSGYWKLDFDRDPTAVDVNFDGNPDWVTGSGQNFNPLGLAGSLFHLSPADNLQLNTSPSNDFTKLATVELICRNTTVGGMGAVFRMYIDRGGSTSGMVYSSVALQVDGTQTVRIHAKTDVATDVQWAEATGLSDQLVHLRFVLNPDADTVAIWINDEWVGTYSYTRFANNGESYFQIAADGSDAEFDYISIRVAE